MNAISDTKHILESTRTIFSTMLKWDLEEVCTSADASHRMNYDVSGIISLAGEVQGTIAISLEREVAFAAAQVFLGESPSDVDDSILDLVAELSNMIGGGVKERLGSNGVSLGLPTSVKGNGHQLSFEPNVVVQKIQLSSPNGNMSLQVALKGRNCP